MAHGHEEKAAEIMRASSSECCAFNSVSTNQRNEKTMASEFHGLYVLRSA